MRRAIASTLCWTSALSIAWAQQGSIEPIRPQAPFIIRPYLATDVPPVRLANSARLRELVRAGMLYLTAQDAIALALENNIDIEVARYNPFISRWNVERAQAGGALPGVPSGASQAASVASGQGVAGSQAAAGVTGGSGSSSTNRNSNATITQVGPVTQTLDPTIQEASTFSHTSAPQTNSVQSQTANLISNTRVYTASYQQGFLTGGNVTVTYSDHYLNENAPSDVLNPSVAPNLSISYTQNLLRGFGIAVNARNITIAKINYRTSDLNFKTQVSNTVSAALNLYYGLAAGYDDVKAKNSAVEVSQKLYDDTKEQVRIGSVAPLELTTAESQLALSQQNLVDSQTNLLQQEVQLKNMLSRTGMADPLIASARIIPVDHIVVPESDDLPPVADLVRQALANRSDIAAEKAGVETAEISAIGTKNGILPTAQVIASESHAGLAGVPHPARINGSLVPPDPYFVGNIGTALGQIFRRDFPTERLTAFMFAQLKNRQAQADYGIDQLQLRQTQLTTQKDLNQVGVDVLNYVVAVRQAKAKYDAAVKNHVLEEQLFEAERKKFSLGASTPYNVIVQQRDLTIAQSSEIAALVAYSNARIALEQTLGTTLQANHVSVDDARAGKVARVSSPPSPEPQH